MTANTPGTEGDVSRLVAEAKGIALNWSERMVSATPRRIDEQFPITRQEIVRATYMLNDLHRTITALRAERDTDNAAFRLVAKATGLPFTQWMHETEGPKRIAEHVSRLSAEVERLKPFEDAMREMKASAKPSQQSET